MSARTPTRILFELRPALEGHAGIPQETRLLFRALRALPDTAVTGLIQSSLQLLPSIPAAAPPDVIVERQGRLVLALDRPRSRRSDLSAAMATIGTALRRRGGGSEALAAFDPLLFRDYLWQRLFARTLPATDLELVTAGPFRVARVPWSARQVCSRFTANFGPPVFAQLDTGEFDLMIAETPYPARMAATTRLVVRYHDAFPLLLPHTINEREFRQATHYLSLRQNVRDGAWFVCVSDATRRDLVSIFPEAEPRSLTIPNMISHHYEAIDDAPAGVARIIATYRQGAVGVSTDPDVAPEYLLMVSSIEPRKNHLAVIAAWEALRERGHPDLKLVVVGGPGWQNEAVMSRLQPWIARGQAVLLRNVPAQDLCRLYRHACATVCPSRAEGFDFSGIEAMRSGGAVVASDIPVHREIYADAAGYFDPYDAGDLVQALVRVIGTGAAPRRQELVARGAVVARGYLPEAVVPQWLEFLGRLRSAR